MYSEPPEPRWVMQTTTGAVSTSWTAAWQSGAFLLLLLLPKRLPVPVGSSLGSRGASVPTLHTLCVLCIRVSPSLGCPRRRGGSLSPSTMCSYSPVQP